MSFPYAWPSSEPGVVYIYNGKCPHCGAEGKTAGAPAIIRVHRYEPKRRRGKPISKDAATRSRFPLLCRGCKRHLGRHEPVAGTPFRIVQMELREEDFYDMVIR